MKGVIAPPENAAAMIDEYPILCVAAALAQGETVMRGIEELRVKESDRIAVMVNGLRAAGVEVEEHEDGMTVHGGRPAGGQAPHSLARLVHDRCVEPSRPRGSAPGLTPTS